MMPAMNAPLAFDDLPDCGLTAQIRAFGAYARTFYTGAAEHDFHLELKAEHSRNVLGHACAIAAAEDVFRADAVRCRALLLAALYHDFGRFRQYDSYGTFRDAQSVNHAHMAVREVKRLRLLEGEAPRVRRLALAGIVLHNRFSVPAAMDADARLVADAVRDADKLDIMRVMAAHLTGEGPVDPVIALHAAPSPEASPAILEAVMARRLGAYADLATTTDFKLLVCGWLYDLNFPFSRQTAAAAGHLAALLASLPATPQLAAFRSRFQKDLTAHAAP